MTDDPFKHNLPTKTIAMLLLCRVVLICLIGATAITIMTVYGPKDLIGQSVTILLGFLSAAIVGLIGLAKSQENAYAIEEHSKTVGTKIDNLADATGQATLQANLVAIKALQEAHSNFVSLQAQTAASKAPDV